MKDERKESEKMNELRPCPFCKSKNLRLSLKRKWQWPRWIICEDCGADGPLVGCSDNDANEAIIAWNTRKGVEKDE